MLQIDAHGLRSRAFAVHAPFQGISQTRTRGLDGTCAQLPTSNGDRCPGHDLLIDHPASTAHTPQHTGKSSRISVQEEMANQKKRQGLERKKE